MARCKPLAEPSAPLETAQATGSPRSSSSWYSDMVALSFQQWWLSTDFRKAFGGTGGQWCCAEVGQAWRG